MTSRRVAFAVAPLLLVAACTSQEAVPNDADLPPLPTVTSTTTTLAPEPTTTLAPETTTTTTTTTTSTTTTTTIPAPSGVPTSSIVEFFAGGDSDGWLYLGRWTGTDWEASVVDGEVFDTAVADGTEVSIHELDVDQIDGTVGATAEACPSGRVGPVISPNARAPEDPGFGFRSIAFEAGWETRPRRVEVVDADVESYVGAGVAAFSDLDIDASGGSIDQIVVSDLDGDGDAESVVVFAGDGFSAVLLIDAQSGAAQTIRRSVQESTIPPAGGGEEGSPAPIVTPNDDHSVLAVADMNGDGLMDVTVHSFASPDSATVSIVTYDGDSADSVLELGC